MAYNKPLPVPSPESRPFWEGCRRHELLLQRCGRCQHHWFPPSTLCPECLSTEWEWARASGRGKVFSFVVYHRLYHPGFKDEIPYCVALIELEEGPHMLSNVVGDIKKIRCDMPVEVFFEDVTEEVSLPKFRGARPAARQRCPTTFKRQAKCSGPEFAALLSATKAGVPNRAHPGWTGQKREVKLWCHESFQQ